MSYLGSLSRFLRAVSQPDPPRDLADQIHARYVAPQSRPQEPATPKCAVCAWPLWPSETCLQFDDGRRIHWPQCFEVRE